MIRKITLTLRGNNSLQIRAGLMCGFITTILKIVMVIVSTLSQGFCRLLRLIFPQRTIGINRKMTVIRNVACQNQLNDIDEQHYQLKAIMSTISVDA